MASLQLPAEYPQLPVLLIGQIETLLKGCAYELVPYIRVVERNFSRGRVVINVFSPQKKCFNCNDLIPNTLYRANVSNLNPKGGGVVLCYVPPPFPTPLL